MSRGRGQFAGRLGALRSTLAPGVGGPKPHRAPPRGVALPQSPAQLVNGTTKLACELLTGDVVVCGAGAVIPADGTVIEGMATVDESAITGESAPVIRESGGDRSAVTGGTRVTSEQIVIEIG